jgi:predicted dehydrogenase
MFRVGIVGAGFMGRTHAAAWSQTPADLAGFHSVDKVKVTALAQHYGAHIYPSLEALIADVDVVDICTPTHLHHEMVLKAANAEKHIVCEKPLARTVTQAREMIAACKRNGVQLLVAHVVRFFPEYALAKGVVERGEIGKVAVVRLTRCSFQPKLAADNWFLDVEKSGGMMLDLMIHDYDYARWVAGDVESVFAKNVRSRDPKASGDYALAILRHTNGAISNIEGGWAYPPPMFRTALEIAGDKGLIEHPAGSSVPVGVYLHKSNDGEAPEVALPKSPLAEDPYTTQIKHFYEVLMNPDMKPRVMAEDGLAALQIALAAIQSAQSGKCVKIAEVQ